MKRCLRFLLGVSVLGLLVSAGCERQHPNAASVPGRKPTLSSFDLPARGDPITPAQAIKFEQADLDQVLKLYAEVSKRSIIRASNLPEVKITFCNQNPLTAVEVLQTLDTALAAQGIVTVLQGADYVKVVLPATACQEAGPVIDLKPEQLPDSSSFLTYITHTKHVPAGDAAKALQTFAKMPNAILAVNGGSGRPPLQKTNFSFLPTEIFAKDNKVNVLVLRDYSSNVKRMLKVLEQVDQ